MPSLADCLSKAVNGGLLTEEEKAFVVQKAAAQQGMTRAGAGRSVVHRRNSSPNAFASVTISRTVVVHLSGRHNVPEHGNLNTVLNCCRAQWAKKQKKMHLR